MKGEVLIELCFVNASISEEKLIVGSVDETSDNSVADDWETVENVEKWEVATLVIVEEYSGKFDDTLLVGVGE